MSQDSNSSQLIKTVNGVKRHTIYYDPDLFEEKIILSASLLIGEDEPMITHYNTIFEEDLGASGEEWKEIEDIAITLYPKPKSTTLIGSRRVQPNSTHTYSIDPVYDTDNMFTYTWEIEGGNAEFVDNPTSNIIVSGKDIDINFTDTGQLTLKCKISNPSGCFRYVVINIFVGVVTKKMLVVRYPYF